MLFSTLITILNIKAELHCPWMNKTWLSILKKNVCYTIKNQF